MTVPVASTMDKESSKKTASSSEAEKSKILLKNVQDIARTLPQSLGLRQSVNYFLLVSVGLAAGALAVSAPVAGAEL